jgi:hypothetical protein
MIRTGHFRWPLVLTLPALAGGILVWQGIVRPHFTGKILLGFSGPTSRMDQELKTLQSDEMKRKIASSLVRPVAVAFEKAPGHPRNVWMKGDGVYPPDVSRILRGVGRMMAEDSLTRQKNELRDRRILLDKENAETLARLEQVAQEQKDLYAHPRRRVSRPAIAAKIAELKSRRQFLIEKYPTHTDIYVLAQQIQDLQRQMSARTGPPAEKIMETSRRLVEAQMRRDYFSRSLKALAEKEPTLKPTWAILSPAETALRPSRVDGWPVGLGVVAGLFILGFVVLTGEKRALKLSTPNGLWQNPVELEVVPATDKPQVPADPVGQQAASLYDRWIQLAQTLYTPAREAPKGIMELVRPLLSQTIDFLPSGHDVLAHHLARSVTPGDLPAHVARTVLMTLTSAEEAGVSPEHRLGLAMAALFHDLAVVPRPPAEREAVGSEVGRLSAALLHRIPGLEQSLAGMIEKILVGMNEFKLETWQNISDDKALEPLSKVLREIDRFEKVMQKQRARLERHHNTGVSVNI